MPRSHPPRKHPEPEPRLYRFEQSLQKAKLSETAVTHYVGVIRRGLEAGDVLAPLRGAASQGGLKIAKAAILRWAAFTRNAGLAKQVRSILSPPRPKAKPVEITVEQRSRIVPHVEAIPDKVRRGFLLLVVWSGLRLGEIFGASRLDLMDWRGTKLAGRTGALRGAEMLLAKRDWKTVRDLLATTVSNHFRSRREKPQASTTYHAGYAVARRLLRRACEAAGVGYVQPEEFRRLVLARPLVGTSGGSE
jgi:integrase